MRVRLTSRAFRDLANITDYVAERSPQAARNVEARLRRSLRILKHAPYLGRTGVRPSVRELTIPKMPFKIIYQITDNTIEVLTVFHTSRDPMGK